MFDFLARNKFLLLTLIVWYIVGTFSTPFFYFVGSASVLLFWRKRMYFELLVGFVFILILSDSLTHATDFAKEFKTIYIILLSAAVFLDRGYFQPYNRIYLYFLPFIIISLVGLIESPFPFTGVQKTLSYLLLFFAVPQIFVRIFKDHGPIVLKDLLFFGSAIVILGFAMRFIAPEVAMSHGERFRGVFGNPNGLGIFTSLIVVIAIICREYFKGFFSKNDLRWIVIPVMAGLLLTGSRTSIMAVFIFFVFVRFYRFSPFIGSILFLGVGIAVEYVAANIVGIVDSLGLTEYFRIETLEEGSGRFIAWSFAWEAIQEYFWFGRGFAFDEWLMNINQDFLNAMGHQGGVHNTYLILWLNSGLVGLLFYLRGVFLLFFKAAKNTPLAFPVLWLILFSIALEPWLAASLNPFTILFLLGITIMTDEVFQPYIHSELNDIEKSEKISVLA